MHLRLTLLMEAVADVCLKIFHRKFSKDPSLLFNELNREIVKLKELKGKRVLKDDQWKLLFPSNGSTDSSKFDVTLICLLIRAFEIIEPPDGGWNVKLIKPDDDSEGANLIRIKISRNENSHIRGDSMKKAEFETKWAIIITALKKLNIDRNKLKVYTDLKDYSFKQSSVEGMKTELMSFISEQLSKLSGK